MYPSSRRDSLTPQHWAYCPHSPHVVFAVSHGVVSYATENHMDDLLTKRNAPPHVPVSSDNTAEGLKALLALNQRYRTQAWPEPFAETAHRFHNGDARELGWLADESVHLVVTSPPYWTLKEYDHGRGQLGDVKDYEAFLAELDKVWRECQRVLVPGGRICCVVGDVCLPRKRAGKHYVMPLHADIQVRARKLGLDCLTPILWHKIANHVTEVEGNGAGY